MAAPKVLGVGMQTNGVAPNRAIDVRFSTDMDPATINGTTFLLAAADTGRNVSGTVTYIAASRAGIFTPSAALDPQTKYNATITTGAADVDGYHMTADYHFSFTTREDSDTSPEGVYSTTPSDGETGVPTTSRIKVIFTEGADPASVSAGFAMKDDMGRSVHGSLTYSVDNNDLVFSPSTQLAANTTYVVTIAGVKDLAGVPMKAPYSFSFTTGAGANDLHFVYSADEYEETIWGWNFNAATSSMTRLPEFAADTVVQLLIGPNQKILYAINTQPHPAGRGGASGDVPGEVVSYLVDHSTGNLTLLQRLTLNGPAGKSAAISPDGRFLYIAEGNENASGGVIDAVALNPDTGTMSFVPGAPFAPTSNQTPDGLAVAGSYIYAQNYQPDPNGGTLRMHGLLVYQRDPSTGSVKFKDVAHVPQGDLAASPSGTTIFTVAYDSGLISAYRVDSATGDLTPEGTASSGSSAGDIRTDTSGHYLAVAANDGVHVYSVSTSGALTQLPGSPFGPPRAMSVAFDAGGEYFAGLVDSHTQNNPDYLVSVYRLGGGTAKAEASYSALPDQQTLAMVSQ